MDPLLHSLDELSWIEARAQQALDGTVGIEGPRPWSPHYLLAMVREIRDRAAKAQMELAGSVRFNVTE